VQKLDLPFSICMTSGLSGWLSIFACTVISTVVYKPSQQTLRYTTTTTANLYSCKKR